MRWRCLFAWVALLALQPVMAEPNWEPEPGNEFQQQSAAAVARFAARDDLQRFFDEAYAYAIFPKVRRVALAFGGAWGKGLVIQNGKLIGRAEQRQLTLGAALGGQSHSQILFFRDAGALETFQLGRREFLGRASATGGVWSASAEPANLPEVAIFSEDGAGLMLELSAAGVRYIYKPLESDSAQ
jgi:lipid-binding SYLF domain-containing protein